MPASGRLLLLSPHCLSARDLARAARDHVGGKIEEQLYGEARSTGFRQKRKRAAVPGRMMSCAGLHLKVISRERFERESMRERRCLPRGGPNRRNLQFTGEGGGGRAEEGEAQPEVSGACEEAETILTSRPAHYRAAYDGSMGGSVASSSNRSEQRTSARRVRHHRKCGGVWRFFSLFGALN